MWIALLLLAGGNLTLGCALGLKLNALRALRSLELNPATAALGETIPSEHSIAAVESSPALSLLHVFFQ